MFAAFSLKVQPIVLIVVRYVCYSRVFFPSSQIIVLMALLQSFVFPVFVITWVGLEIGNSYIVLVICVDEIDWVLLFFYFTGLSDYLLN